MQSLNSKELVIFHKQNSSTKLFQVSIINAESKKLVERKSLFMDNMLSNFGRIKENEIIFMQRFKDLAGPYLCKYTRSANSIVKVKSLLQKK